MLVLLPIFLCVHITTLNVPPVILLAKGAIIGNKTIKTIAETKGVTEAQVAIRWSLQSDIITIPKSTKISRLEQNCDVFDFELSSSEMLKISSLDSNMRVSWDPSNVV